jgi:hypothetical protein
MEDISILGYDNEDQYMDKNNYNNKHQLMINHNIHHHFDNDLLVLFTHPPSSNDTSVPDGHDCGIISIGDTQ